MLHDQDPGGRAGGVGLGWVPKADLVLALDLVHQQLCRVCRHFMGRPTKDRFGIQL